MSGSAAPRPRPEIIASFDQAKAEIGQVAALVAAYRRGLIHEGIPDPLLGDLTREFQASYLFSLFPDPPERPS